PIAHRILAFDGRRQSRSPCRQRTDLHCPAQHDNQSLPAPSDLANGVLSSDRQPLDISLSEAKCSGGSNEVDTTCAMKRAIFLTVATKCESSIRTAWSASNDL